MLQAVQRSPSPTVCPSGVLGALGDSPRPLETYHVAEEAKSTHPEQPSPGQAQIGGRIWDY